MEESKRSIAKIIEANDVMMGNFKIAQPLPAAGIKQVDPFLLIHHAGPVFQEPGSPGLNVEAHPHTGFEPVTFVFSGEVEHRDSLGNRSIIKSGGVQWINAGKGIVHSEKASPEFITRGGEFEIIQLWINLPGRLKKSDPAYFGFEEKEIPYYLSDDNRTRLNVIAGEYKSLRGPVQSRTDIHAYTAVMEHGGDLQLSISEDLNVIIYVLNGLITAVDRPVEGKQLIVFNQDGSHIGLKASDYTKLLILAGSPIKEPVFTYGPFVLNSKQEAIEAINNYESGRMGYLD